METPNTFESVQPCSGEYSFRKDLRLNTWLLVATVVYLATLYVLKHHPAWSPPTRAALALAPLLPGLLYLRACLRFVRGLDELQRRIQMEAWLFAALGALISGTVLNTLNGQGVDLGVLPQGLSLEGTFALTFALWALGLGLANRRYK